MLGMVEVPELLIYARVVDGRVAERKREKQMEERTRKAGTSQTKMGSGGGGDKGRSGRYLSLGRMNRGLSQTRQLQVITKVRSHAGRRSMAMSLSLNGGLSDELDGLTKQPVAGGELTDKMTLNSS